MPSAPDGSTTSRLRSAASRTAAAISASVTVTIESSSGAQMGERPDAERLGPRPVGDRPRDELGRPRHDLAALQRIAGVGGQLRLDADHACLRPERLDRDGDAARQPAAADRHEDRREVRQVLDHLEPDRALPGDDPVVVERRDDDEPAAGRDLERDLLALVAGRSRRRRPAPRPPRPAVRLIAGASDGITTTAGAPSSRAARATPWAWLPDE